MSIAHSVLPAVAFDGFPYLVTRVVPAMFHLMLLPADLGPSNLREIARWQVQANKLRACLVFGPRECVYLDPDARESDLKDDIPFGQVFLSGCLQPCVEFPDSEELLRRKQRLEEFLGQLELPDCMFGDLTKGGRRAAPSEAWRLAGSQNNGVPRGLMQCPQCGEWRGECLDPSPLFRGMLMRVHCQCENDNLCARCGRPLHSRKLNANFYNPADHTIWHVPGFSGFHHRCGGES